MTLPPGHIFAGLPAHAAGAEQFLNGRIVLHCGDCLEAMAQLAENSIDACVCDPPYHLTSIVKRFGDKNAAPAKHGTDGAFKRASAGFMGSTWDGGDIAFRPETWAAVLRVLKPGAYLVAFCGTRTSHRVACAVEDAGFIIHPFIAWCFAQGFPKAHKVHAEEWEGWRYGTQSLKPAIEPIYVGQKPFEAGLTGTENVLKWGTGALNIDGCRVAGAWSTWKRNDGSIAEGGAMAFSEQEHKRNPESPLGRWPANVIHDGSDEVVAAFPDAPGQQSNVSGNEPSECHNGVDNGPHNRQAFAPRGDSGSAARFFKTCNGRDGEASAERRYTEEGSTNFAALPGARRDGVEASRLFYQTKQDFHCGLCHSPYDASWNANTAKNSSKTASILSENIVRSDAPGSLVPESVDKQSHGRGHARNAAHGLYQCHPLSGSSAQQHAHDWPLSRIVQNVKSAAILCDSCATDIARALVALRQVRSVASVQFKDFIGGRNAPILCQHLALYVADRESTDIILTTESLKQLFGSVFHAIESCTVQSEVTPKESSEKSKRLWYGSKADFDDRLGSKHPTVKPLDLMEYLCRLVTPPGGTVLDPFAGTGTTGEAAFRGGFNAVLIEREAEYQADIRRRMALVLAGPDERTRESIKARGMVASPGPLFETPRREHTAEAAE
jgi:site-specific DNA-methyltransferase (adenine-specific)